MTRIRRTSRPGAALLIVLAVLVVVTSAAVVFAEVISMEKLHRRSDIDSHNAMHALRASNSIVHEWLIAQSDSIVLPPEAAAPGVQVLHEHVTFEDQAVTIQITAWDQCGMVNLQAVRDGSPLRLTIPEDVLQAVDTIEIDDRTPAGLDLVHTDDISSRARIFPQHGQGERVHFGNSNVAARDDIYHTMQRGSAVPQLTAVGAHIATHNTAQQLNVNTAPLPLLERALLMAGRGGLEHIEQQRGDGKAVSLNQLPAADNRDPQQSAPQLVGTSSSWSFRVDVRVGMVRTAWWMVYQRRNSKWECVQRLVIDE